MMRLECDEIVVGQILEAVGQWLREFPLAPADDDDVQKLLLER